MLVHIESVCSEHSYSPRLNKHSFRDYLLTNNPKSTEKQTATSYRRVHIFIHFARRVKIKVNKLFLLKNKHVSNPCQSFACLIENYEAISWNNFRKYFDNARHYFSPTNTHTPTQCKIKNIQIQKQSNDFRSPFTKFWAQKQRRRKKLLFDLSILKKLTAKPSGRAKIPSEILSFLPPSHSNYFPFYCIFQRAGSSVPVPEKQRRRERRPCHQFNGIVFSGKANFDSLHF